MLSMLLRKPPLLLKLKLLPLRKLLLNNPAEFRSLV